MKRADIKTNFSCNNHCLFCVQGKKRSRYPDKSTQQIKQEMESAIKDCQGLVLTGGEPTVRPDILELVAYAKNLGFKLIQIQSNGRMFAYNKFCKDIIAAGANEFGPALHGHIAQLHDYLTGAKGSFAQVVQGIKNLKSLGQAVLTNTVINKSNYRHLPQIAKLLVSLDVDQYQFAFVHPLGSARKNFSSIVPRMTLVESFVKRGLDIGIEADKIVMTEAIPYCFMRDYEDYVAERIIPDSKIYDYKKIIDDFTSARRNEGKSKGPRCRFCRYNMACEGPWREYPQHFGWNEFKPVLKKHDGANKMEQIVEDLFSALIKSVGLINQSKEIVHLRKILFSGFDQAWLSKNQKFDFSFSSQGAPSLRFSLNDFGEKDSFYEKLKKIFVLFPGQYNQKVFKKIMELMGTKNAPHQTTFGFEWVRGTKLPRLKIYFEELFNVYDSRKTRQLAKSLGESMSIGDNNTHLDNQDTVAALGVDFFPDKSVALKSYVLYKNRKAIEDGIKKTGGHFDHKVWADVIKVGGDRAFFYLTKRINQSGEIKSMKLYKIFEFSLFTKIINQRIKAVDILLKTGGKNEAFGRFRDYLKRNEASLNPVILAADVDKEKNIKIDCYLALKP